MERRLYGLADLLKVLPRSRTQLYRDMTAGLLPYVQVGKRRYFEPEGIDQYVKALKAERPAMLELVSLIDDSGRIDIDAIPAGATLADLERAKRIFAERKATDAAA